MFGTALVSAIALGYWLKGASRRVSGVLEDGREAPGHVRPAQLPGGCAGVRLFILQLWRTERGAFWGVFAVGTWLGELALIYVRS